MLIQGEKQSKLICIADSEGRLVHLSQAEETLRAGLLVQSLPYPAAKRREALDCPVSV